MIGSPAFARPARLFYATALAVFVCGLAAACSADGETPDCPPLPPYNVRDFDGGNPDPAIAAAAAKGCVTPIGTATSVRDAGPG